MTAGFNPFEVGERVYLVPTLSSAPTAAYLRPECTVVAIATARRVLVELADGARVETDIANVKRSLPVEEPRVPRAPRQRPVMPDGYAEVALW